MVRGVVMLSNITGTVMSIDIANIRNKMMRVSPQRRGNIAHC